MPFLPFRFVLASLAISLAMFSASPTWAVVIKGGSGNTTAPVDDPGFANVGRVGGGSLVYLGNYATGHYVLTTAHTGLGATQVELGGVNYAVPMGGITRLKDPMTLVDTDLTLIKINYTGPVLPNINISTSLPALNSQLTLIGSGLNQQSTLNYWFQDAMNNWTDLGSNPAGSNRSGFKYSGGGIYRWGTNQQQGTANFNSVIGMTNFGPVKGFGSIFDESGSSNEAQVVLGDSGGGVFYKNGLNWELAGIIVQRGNGYTNQPIDPMLFNQPFPMFGNSSLYADLSQYRSQILSVVPEPSTFALALVAGLMSFSAIRRGSSRS